MNIILLLNNAQDNVVSEIRREGIKESVKSLNSSQVPQGPIKHFTSRPYKMIRINVFCIL